VGQLVLVDGGAELSGYCSDVTRCLPVGGQLDPVQRALLEALFAIQDRLVRAIRPGLPLGALEELGARLQCQALVDLGVLRGHPETLFAASAQRRYTRHRLCHFVGLDVHDGGTSALEPARPLAPGMVLAIEPGFYLGRRDPELGANWRGLAARLEDQVLVTATGADLWTYGAPRAPSEVEAACQLGLSAHGGSRGR
jgi:Xaa-Pro aminopeptidase